MFLSLVEGLFPAGLFLMKVVSFQNKKLVELHGSKQFLMHLAILH